MDCMKILRSALCLLVVCCLVINCSPLKADAVVAEAAVVTGAGVMATMFAMAMGIVAVDLTVQLVNGMGQSLVNRLQQWGSDTGKSDDVDSFLASIPATFDIASSDVLEIPKDLLGGFIDWGKGLICGEGVDVEGESAPEGYSYYNGILLPVFTPSDDYPLLTLAGSPGNYRFVASSDPGEYTPGSAYFPSSHQVWKCTNGSDWVYVGKGGKGYQPSCTTPFYSNYDMYYENSEILALAKSEPLSASSFPYCPDVYVGDIPQQVQDGTFEEEKYELPYINYNQVFQGQTDTVAALNNVATQLQNQTLTYEQYMAQIRAESGVVAEPITGTFADTAVGAFIDALIDAITAPFEWLADTLLAGIKALFVPSEGYVESKVDELTAEYSFANSIALTAKDLRTFLTSLGSVPPVIRIDLGAYTGQYNYGGEMVLIDFSFYEPYKPTMDAILSAFLWLWFVWRVILGLPGIISGASGLSGPKLDSSHVGVSGPFNISIPSDSMPKHVPQLGGETHFREWLRNRNDAHYNEFHKGGK